MDSKPWVVGLPLDYVGVYVDIGACFPVAASDTYRLYQRGWRGICVEPHTDHCVEFRRQRPGDQVLNLAVSRESCTMVYHRFENSVLNGIFGQDTADLHIRSGQKYLGGVPIECLGIREFLRTYVRTPVDVLNIDIETLEVDVLGQWDWSISRPTIICAEIHSLRLEDMLASEVAQILKRAGYSAMSRVWQSAIFVDDAVIDRLMRREAARHGH